jgi:hypothetical protein
MRRPRTAVAVSLSMISRRSPAEPGIPRARRGLVAPPRRALGARGRRLKPRGTRPGSAERVRHSGTAGRSFPQRLRGRRVRAATTPRWQCSQRATVFRAATWSSPLRWNTRRRRIWLADTLDPATLRIAATGPLVASRGVRPQTLFAFVASVSCFPAPRSAVCGRGQPPTAHGTRRHGDEPCRGPLESLVGYALAGWFTWMFEVELGARFAKPARARGAARRDRPCMRVAGMTDAISRSRGSTQSSPRRSDGPACPFFSNGERGSGVASRRHPDSTRPCSSAVAAWRMERPAFNPAARGCPPR